MTQTPAEIFTIQLGRATSRQADKFLAARGVSRPDRDDVIAAALLWCWEHRAKYSLTTTVETWFMNAIRDAYKALRRGELPTSAETFEGMGAGDTTYDTAAAASAAAAIVVQLTPVERRIAYLTMKGYTKDEMLELGLRESDIRQARTTIKSLRALLPDASTRTVIAHAPGVEHRTTSSIDRELEQLDAPPPHGKECSPCIHCNWWEFRYRVATSPQVAATADAEIVEAQRNILRRKIEISGRVSQ
jgi:DNA-binding CsgD family transcriptional regulator